MTGSFEIFLVVVTVFFIAFVVMIIWGATGHNDHTNINKSTTIYIPKGEPKTEPFEFSRFPNNDDSFWFRKNLSDKSSVRLNIHPAKENSSQIPIRLAKPDDIPELSKISLLNFPDKSLSAVSSDKFLYADKKAGVLLASRYDSGKWEEVEFKKTDKEIYLRLRKK